MAPRPLDHAWNAENLVTVTLPTGYWRRVLTALKVLRVMQTTALAPSQTPEVEQRALGEIDHALRATAAKRRKAAKRGG